MDIRAIFSLQASLTAILSLFLLIMTAASATFFPEEKATWAFATAFGVSVAVALLLRLLGGDLKKRNIGLRESFVIVTSAWILYSAIAGIPYLLTGTMHSFTDAFFESMSGFTTTGASVLTDVEAAGKSVLLWRAMTNFIGGGGIVVLTVAILPALSVGGVQMINREASTPFGQKMIPKLKQTARQIWTVYLVLNLILAVLLFAGGMPVFESITHAFATIATGGFSPLNGSIGTYAQQGHAGSLYFEIIIIIFMFLGSVGFYLHYAFFSGNFTAYFRDPQFRFFLTLVLIASLMISLDLFLNGYYSSFGSAVRASLFSVVTIASTTGFGTDNFSNWSDFSRFVLIALMFFGGNTGSTAGGMKSLRVIAGIKQSLYEIFRMAHPRQVFAMRLGDQFLSLTQVRQINTFLFTYVISYIAGLLVFAIFEEDFETIASSAAAALNNIGPGTSLINGPAGNYAFMSTPSKWVFSYFMLLGRLELFPVLVVFTPWFWRKN